jgi:hypothetical protein
MKTEIKDISFTKGDSYGLQIELDTEITNITKVFFTVKDKSKHTEISKQLNYENNIITLSLKPKDTDSLLSNYKYNYDIQVNYGTEDKLTILRGAFKLDGEITETGDEVV